MDPSQKLLVDEIDKLFAERFDRLFAVLDRHPRAAGERDASDESRIGTPLPLPGVTPTPTPSSAVVREASRFLLDTDGSKLDSEDDPPVQNRVSIDAFLFSAGEDEIPNNLDTANSSADVAAVSLHALDRLSLLPDVVLRNIVSRLPVKDAARTVVLSRRWRPLWRAPFASLVRSNQFEQDAVQDLGRLFELGASWLMEHPGMPPTLPSRCSTLGGNHVQSAPEEKQFVHVCLVDTGCARARPGRARLRRPSPWPSFSGSGVSSEPPWPLQPQQSIRCVPATALTELLTCMMVMSVSTFASGLILKLAQRKCGGICWYFLLEGSQLKDIGENSEGLVLAGTCPDQASVYMASGNYMIMSGQLDDIDLVELPVQNPLHQELLKDSTQLRPLPWPSFSTYACSVQLNAFLSVAVHEFGISWGPLAEMRPISSMVLLLSIFGHSASMLALDGLVIDRCKSPKCLLLLSSIWPVKKKHQLLDAGVVLNLVGYVNMDMLPSALNPILTSLKCGNHLKQAVLVPMYKFCSNGMSLHQFTTTVQAPPVGVMWVLLEDSYLAHEEFQFTSKIHQQLGSIIIQKMIESSCNLHALVDLIDEGYCQGDDLIAVPWQLPALATPPAPRQDTGSLEVKRNKKQRVAQFLWDPGGFAFLHRLGGKPNFKKGGMSGVV